MWVQFSSSHTSPHMSPVTVCVWISFLHSVCKARTVTHARSRWVDVKAHAGKYFYCNCAYRTKVQIRKMNFCWFFPLDDSTLAQITEGEEEGKHNIYTWAQCVDSTLNAHVMQTISNIWEHICGTPESYLLLMWTDRCGQFTRHYHFYLKTFTIYKEE